LRFLGRPTFYRFVNGKLSCKSGVGTLKTPSGDMIADGISNVEQLSYYFADDGNLPEYNRQVDHDVCINEIIFLQLISLKQSLVHSVGL